MNTLRTKSTSDAMPKIACLTLSYHAHTFDRALEGIAGAGYRYVAFGTAHQDTAIPAEDNQDEAKRLRAKFAQFALEPIVLFAHSQFHPDLPIARAIAQLEMAHELQIPEVNTISFWGYRQFPDEPLPQAEYDALNERFIERYRELANTAERLGVMITLKPHTGNSATGPILLDTLQKIDSPYVKACYDPGNIGYYEGLDPETDFPIVAQETVSFVAKEQGKRGQASYDFSVPGEGDYDFVSMFSLLRSYSFAGPVIVEKLDKDGQALEVQEIDRRAKQARVNLERILAQAGYVK